jgi:glycosyltransferase involved in cell wall biosynthesis
MIPVPLGEWREDLTMIQDNEIEAQREIPPPILAIVVPCYNEEDVINSAITQLRAALEGLKSAGLISSKSYLYFVDDGSVDNTWAQLERAHADYGSLYALKLTRNFGHQNALLAGLMSVNGRCDAAVSIDADLQQDPGKLPLFVKHYLEGAEVVFGVRNDRNCDGWFKKSSATLFYRMMTAMGVVIIPHHADYRLMGRRAISTLAEFTEPNIFLRAMCLHLGFPYAVVNFDVRERTLGTSKYSLSKMLKLAVDGVVSFSITPLRAIAFLGIIIFGICIGMGVYVLVSVLQGRAVPGWASTTLPLYTLGGIQLLCLSIIGEYIAQVVTAVRRRPRYICERELS